VPNVVQKDVCLVMHLSTIHLRAMLIAQHRNQETPHKSLERRRTGLMERLSGERGCYRPHDHSLLPWWGEKIQQQQKLTGEFVVLGLIRILP
jgi:hypothetical protein